MGDPGLVAVTAPDDSHGGVRVLYTNVGQSSNRGKAGGGSDIVVAVSDNGGQTFTNAQYVDIPGQLGSQTNTLLPGTDFPQIAADPHSPYGVWVSWTVGATGYINWIRYDTNLAYTRGTPMQIPDPLTAVHMAAITVGTVQSCSGAHEAVYVAWVTDGMRNNQACQDGGQSYASPVWEWAAYDTVTGTWYPNDGTGAYPLDQDNQFPQCIGSPIVGGSLEPSADSSGPSIASLDVNVILAHPHHTTYGTKIYEQGAILYCDPNGHMVPSYGPISMSPVPCYVVGGACPATDAGAGNGPDGGIVRNDDWGAKVVYTLKPPSTTEMLITYYSTRLDPNNNKVGIWGGTAVGVFDNPFASIFTVANAATPTQTVPWDVTLAPWWDYQGIGVEPQGSFFAAWGGDARYGASGAGIFGARLQ